MDLSSIFSISMETWGILTCLIAMVGVALGRSQFRARRSIKLTLLLLCVVLLLNDSLSFAFRGQSGTLAYYLVRICNYMVFFTNYACMSVFSVFLWQSLEKPGESKPKRLYTIFILSVSAIMLLTISQFSNFIYYFDAQNYYHRSTGYFLTQLFALAGLAVSLSLLVQYRDRVDRPMFLALLSYFVLPLAATLVMIFYYGLPLQNMAIVISTLLMFVVDLVDISNRLVKSQLQYQQASHAAEHDAMTGLLTKTAGLQKITDYVQSMQEQDSAFLLFFDIDDFKSINDTYGHAMGDHWIQEVASLLQSTCRRDDICCRFGGDEFLICLKGLSDTQILKQRLHHFSGLLMQSSAESGIEVHCSAGICKLTGAGCDPAHCIELADHALYQVKTHGKAGFQICEADAKKCTINQELTIAPELALPAQNQLLSVFLRFYSSVLYLNLSTGLYQTIQTTPELENLLKPHNRFDENLSVFLKAEVDPVSHNTMKQFLSRERLLSQTEDLASEQYRNRQGEECVAYTLTNLNGISADPKIFLLLFCKKKKPC